MSSQRRKVNISNPTNPPKRSNRRIPIQDNTSNTDEVFQKKLTKLSELQSGLEILKDRMTQSKQDLIEYFNKNPHLKIPKYSVGAHYIRYTDKKNTDGLSQKLIIKGLSEYFKNAQINNVEEEVSKALFTILSQRGAKIVPTIDISKDKSMSTNDTEADE